MREDDFVTVPVDGEDPQRPSDHDVSAVASFAFAEDERRGGKLDDLGDLGKFTELACIEIAEQSEALEELFAFHSIIILRYRTHCKRASRRSKRDVTQRLVVPQTTKSQRDTASK